MNIVTRFLNAPNRTIQITIWVMLAAVLGFAIPAATTPTSSASSATTSVSSSVATAPGTATLASDSTLTLAAAPPPAGATAQENWPTDNSSELLPAYRWRGALGLPSQLGVMGSDVGLSAMTLLADVCFSIASWIWWLLLALTKFALSMDVVAAFSHTINGIFASTYHGLSNSGLTSIVAVAAVVLAAGAALRQKLGQGLRMIVGAVLVLGLMQSLGTAAAADTASTADGAGTGYSAPAGTPAWFAATGNEYVNQIAFQASSLFGATSGITESVRDGGAGPSDGSQAGVTCAYYNQRLYATYQAVMNAKGGVNASTASALSMVSFMWQRSMYDNWTTAAFSDSNEGGRIACHVLENNRGVPANVQQAIAGSDLASSPYHGIATGPFMVVPDDEKANEAATLAWAVCQDGQVARTGWRDVANLNQQADAACQGWFTSTSPGGLTAAQPGALNWRNTGALERDTLNKGPELAKVNEVVMAYWGHNASQRFLAASTSLLTSGIYAYAFAGPAVGVLLSQFVLLMLLLILPWTLLLLAMPSKDGNRSSIGKKLLRTTAMAFGGKIVFLTVMGVTLTVMSSLFAVTMAQPELTAYTGASAASADGGGTYTMWSILVPAVAIVVVRMLLKGLGMGNLMGLSGAMGFATAAVTQGRDGAKLGKRLTAATTGGKLHGTVTKGQQALKSRLGARGRGLANGAKGVAASALMTKTRSDGKGGTKLALDDDLAAKITTGKLGLWQAHREQRMRNRGLPENLAERVRKGEMPYLAAKQLAAANDARLRMKFEQAAEERRKNNPDATLPILEGIAGVGAAPVAPPFKSGAPAVLPGSTIAGNSEPAREQAEAVAREVHGPASPERWSAAHVEPLGQAFEVLCSQTRADGHTGDLTPEQVESARAAIAQAVGPTQESRILVGTCGAPPLVLPAVTPDGRFSAPEVVFNDPALAMSELSNPMMLLDPRELAPRKGEDDNARHARLTFSLMQQNLLDPSGAHIDVLEELGIDRSAPNAGDLALDFMRSGRLSAPEELMNARRTATPAQRVAVNRAVTLVSSTSGDRSASDNATELAAALAAAPDLRASAATAVSKLQEQAAQINVSVVDLKEIGKSRTAILRIAEQDAESIATRLQAATIELQYRSRAAGGDPDGAARESLATELESLQDSVIAFRRTIAHKVAAVVQTNGDRSRDELVDLSRTLADELKNLTGKLDAAAAQAPAQAHEAAAAAALLRSASRGAGRAASRRENVHDA